MNVSPRLLAALAVTLFARAVCGQQLATAHAPYLEIVTVEPEHSALSLRALLSPVLQRTQIDVHWTTARNLNLEDLFVSHGSETDLVARVWIDRSEPTHARLYLADRLSRRFLVRDIHFDSDADEMSAETLGTIVESAVEALREGSEIGVSRTEARAMLATPERSSSPPTSPPIQPTIRHAVRTDIGLQYEAVAIGAPTLIAHAADLSITVSSNHGTFHPIAWTTLGLRFSVTYFGEPIGVTLTTTMARALLGAEWTASHFVQFRAGIGGGIDVTYVEPRLAQGANATPTAAHFDSVPALRTAFGANFHVRSGLSLMVGLACDLDLRTAHYDVLVGGTTRTPVLTLWTVEPAFFFGASWQFGRSG